MSGNSKSKHLEDAHFDVTPMVDLVFMMNIYFMVAWLTAANAEMDLPNAKHVVPTDIDNAVTISVVEKGAQGTEVFVGDSGAGQGLTNPAEIEQRIKQTVESSVAKGSDVVLVKAERRVRLRDVARISGIVATVPKVKLRVGVLEKN